MSEKDAMDQPPIPDERILEAIEACRPGSDDSHDPALVYLAAELEANPELRDLYQRLQGVDAKVAAAFRDVPVPEGLHQRLIEQLAAARSGQVTVSRAEQEVETAAAESTKTSPPRRRRPGRRWLLAAGGALTSAAVLMVAAWIHYGPDTLAEQDVLDYASEFFNGEGQQTGHSLVDTPPRRAYPLSRAVVQVRGIKWRPLSKFLGRSGVAYDIPGRGGACATLYVVKRTIGGLPRRPPLQPGKTTAGCSVSTWQEGKLLYVLAVQGNSQTYRGFLKSRGPLT